MCIRDRATVANDPDLELVKSLMADLADDGISGAAMVSEPVADLIPELEEEVELTADDGLDDILNNLDDDLVQELETPDAFAAEPTSGDDVLDLGTLEVEFEETSLKEIAIDDAPDTDDASLALSDCLLYTSPSPRDRTRSRMPSSA